MKPKKEIDKKKKMSKHVEKTVDEEEDTSEIVSPSEAERIAETTTARLSLRMWWPKHCHHLSRT